MNLTKNRHYDKRFSATRPGRRSGLGFRAGAQACSRRNRGGNRIPDSACDTDQAFEPGGLAWKTPNFKKFQSRRPRLRRQAHHHPLAVRNCACPISQNRWTLMAPLPMQIWRPPPHRRREEVRNASSKNSSTTAAYLDVTAWVRRLGTNRRVFWYDIGILRTSSCG